MNEETKRCSRCGEEKDLRTGFSQDRRRKDGSQSWCKDCWKKYYKENREKAVVREKRYRGENREKVVARMKRYREENREKEAARHKEYRRSLRGQWRKLKKHAHRKGWDCDISEVTFAKLRSRPCFYCGANLPVAGYGLDRLDSSKGYVKGNVVPCCWPCNEEKNAMPWQAFALMKENRSLDEIPVSERSYHMLLGYWKLWEGEDVSN